MLLDGKPPTAPQLEHEPGADLRACATALGAIGPAAAPALPVLREIAKQPRVRWAAEAAIRRIGGAPE